ncbi:MAG: TetR/AcrR family transcriptional regulator [Candidatus Tectomicrobia bacterium]|uniref:TetR/AcrR family transcriptional regulator n=1 Tax=Tectimicrobiota bacterium TaxID=2528274 RepID=A0A932HYY6_UNCTE|nr:TetR/AcrR family transcriptional regulator [Candidatus Tectomicrobia bacterium]
MTTGTAVAEKRGTREKVILAAADLIYRQGFTGTSLDMVAVKAGVNRGSLYYFFRSKKNLGSAVIGHYERLLHENFLEPALGGEGTGREKLARLADLYSHLPLSDRPCCGCPIGNLSLELSGLDEELRLHLKEVWTGVFARVAEAVRQAQEEGELDPGADAIGLARAFFAQIQGAHLFARTSLDEDALRGDCRQALDALPWTGARKRS